ncbi:hypothetical protein FDP41_009292 [Naegleria fowleri]|uniref:Glutathione peroxidase n=1 Tax=Naegleria fowleri TaxID=5763 RepID=A0A6A5BH98_NAEFO|nr:uncharacterized protein FDP41_009292 [Naegleria fowleri]KAF0972389.1 hypothetical protein FDP41_009292 [Naegleria fowleri]CAG4707838.1 unnamed protein product [Naegleria fowleri]
MSQQQQRSVFVVSWTTLLSLLTSLLFVWYLIHTQQLSEFVQDTQNKIWKSILFTPTTTHQQQQQQREEFFNVYNFTVIDSEGHPIALNSSQYLNKVLLIVNVASQCGFTPQYESLQRLYEKYGPQNNNNGRFEILAFPCNQFGYQEPAPIRDVCEFATSKYHITFKLFNKVNVNGKDTIPLYRYLKEQAPGFISNGIKWNFTKFLVNSKGQVVGRYSPITNPESLSPIIERLLNE